MRYERVHFDLRSGPAPGVIGHDHGTPVLLTDEYSPWPTTSISALLGVEFNGNLRQENSRGELVEHSDYRPAPLLAFAFRNLF